jgi:uncharacterized protein (DUF1499 family)
MEASSLVTTTSPSRLATISGALGVASASLFVLGPVTIQLGITSPFIGFRIFGVGFLLALFALVLGAVALWLTRSASGRSGRGRAGAGFGLGLVVFAVVAALLGSTGNPPMINDITTDPGDPPQFVAAARAEGNAGRDLSYPGESFATQQREAYSDLAPLHLDVPLLLAYLRAKKAVSDLGWQITAVTPVNGMIEATDTSHVFRFVDDVVIRVRINGSASIVDVRSKSRDGKSDMGANAARIRAFLAAMQEPSK